MTAELTAKNAEAITEISECVKSEGAGRVLGADGDVVRISFTSVLEAASWIGNYATAEAATFETAPATMAQRVTVHLSVAAYIEAAGL